MKQLFLRLIVYPFHELVSWIISKFDPLEGFFYWLDHVELKKKKEYEKNRSKNRSR